MTGTLWRHFDGDVEYRYVGPAEVWYTGRGWHVLVAQSGPRINQMVLVSPAELEHEFAAVPAPPAVRQTDPRGR